MESRYRSVVGTRILLWIVVGILWIGCSCGGLIVLNMYANSPGHFQQSPTHWPNETTIWLSERGATLIMFVHPKCPCTRASLGELEKIVARFHGSFTPWVVFFKPLDSDESWDHTDLRETAAAIPGVHVLTDLGGVEASRFHATTSGETILYNNQGERLFHGGITLARGHAGDNAGRSAIEDSLKGTVPVCSHTSVFGCPIAVSLDQD